MGWLIFGKKQGRSSSRRQRPAAVRAKTQPWDPKRTLSGLKILAAAVVIVGFVAGWSISERRLMDYARRQAADQRNAVTPGGVASALTEVELVDAPSWMSEGLRNHLRHVVSRELNDGDILDSSALQRVVEALHAQPWVALVERVERSRDTRVLVTARYRQPVALVRDRQQKFHLVDGYGVLLPADYDRDQISRINLPLIVGVAAKPGRSGRIWPGDDLQSGLSLASLIVAQPFADQVMAIDVSGRDRQGYQRIALHTRGAMVRWGYPPGEEQAIEASATTKLQRLINLHARYGYIAPRGQMVDIFGPQILAHSLSSADRKVLVSYTWTR